MSRRSNRRSKAKRALALLSCRAELTLLHDGAPMPNHYLELGLTDTRNLVRSKQWQLENRSTISFTSSPYQAQLDIAAKQLQIDLDRELIRSLMTPSLDK